jgi:hypothetical protein
MEGRWAAVADAGEASSVGILDKRHLARAPSSLPIPIRRGTPIRHAVVLGAGSCQFSGGTNPGQAVSAANNQAQSERELPGDVDAGVGNDRPGRVHLRARHTGHGTHTDSSVAGNAAFAARSGQLGGTNGTASLPRAHVIAYKVCAWSSRTGFTLGERCRRGRAAGVRRGVDVINYSISGGIDPYNEVASIAFSTPTRPAIFVAGLAGNNGRR